MASAQSSRCMKPSSTSCISPSPPTITTASHARRSRPRHTSVAWAGYSVTGGHRRGAERGVSVQAAPHTHPTPPLGARTLLDGLDARVCEDGGDSAGVDPAGMPRSADGVDEGQQARGQGHGRRRLALPCPRSGGVVAHRVQSAQEARQRRAPESGHPPAGRRVRAVHLQHPLHVPPGARLGPVQVVASGALALRGGGRRGGSSEHAPSAPPGLLGVHVQNQEHGGVPGLRIPHFNPGDVIQRVRPRLWRPRGGAEARWTGTTAERASTLRARRAPRLE